MSCCDDENFPPAQTGIAVQDEGIEILAEATTLDFVGAGVTVTDAGGGVAQIDIPAGGSDNPYSPPERWGQENVAANQAAVALSAMVSINFDDIKMIRAGSIVGLATRFTEAITAGQATVIVTKNGVATALQVVHTNAANQTGGIATAAIAAITYVAGDLIGMTITTNGAFLPLTTDVEAWLQLSEDL
jgi:hypothetical protein